MLQCVCVRKDAEEARVSLLHVVYLAVRVAVLLVANSAEEAGRLLQV